jgi:hypothetical protein
MQESILRIGARPFADTGVDEERRQRHTGCGSCAHHPALPAARQGGTGPLAHIVH